MLGVYAALTLRAFVYGNDVSQWGLRWRVETDWLPFLTVITVLVFWRAGLYAERERRAGFGRILASLALVAVVTLIFTIGTGHNFRTYGLAPTAVVTERGLHRSPARELRRDHGRPAQGGGRPAARDPRRQR